MTAKAYVIMPVGSDPAHPARRAAIESGISAAGYTAHFPLDENTVGAFDLEKAKTELGSAAVVIVDLTHERPSCYYELGLAQAQNSSVLVFAERGTTVHQLSGRDDVEFYDSVHDLPPLITDAISRAKVAPESVQHDLQGRR